MPFDMDFGESLHFSSVTAKVDEPLYFEFESSVDKEVFLRPKDFTELTFSFDYLPSENAKRYIESVHNFCSIDKVIFNGPATIVFWSDGTKTVVKCKEGETFDKWTGLSMALAKRVYGDKFHHIFREICEKGE